ncbi:MAG: hypothetical protein K5925_01405 [Bacilli bacterium]|nr:hypothetical protein [Bacilli bacterium]
MFDVVKEVSSQLVTMEQYINNRDQQLLLRISVDMEVIKRVKDVDFTHFLFTTINSNIRNYLTDQALSLELKYTSGNYIMLSSVLAFLQNLEEFDDEDLSIISNNIEQENMEETLTNHFQNKYPDKDSKALCDKANELVLPIKYAFSIYTTYRNAIAEVTITLNHMNTFKMMMGKEFVMSLKEKNASNGPEDNKVTSSSKSGGCYIATAIYHSYDCKEVYLLRRYRDYYLAKRRSGRLFIKIYYKVSPTLVKHFGNTKIFRNIFKPFLDKKVDKLIKEGYSSLPYND